MLQDYILLRYRPRTSNSALAICPSEQQRTASMSTSNTFRFSTTAGCNRASIGPDASSCRAWKPRRRNVYRGTSTLGSTNEILQRIVDLAIDHDAFAQVARPFPKRALRRNADFVEPGLPGRRFDARDRFAQVLFEVA